MKRHHRTTKTAAPAALRIGSMENLRIGVRRELWPRWKFISSWPPRLQSRQDYLPCSKCNCATTLYLTDNRIWASMHKSWKRAVLCFTCLRCLVDHPEEEVHVHPAEAERTWEYISSLTRTQWSRIVAQGGDLTWALNVISTVDWDRWRRLTRPSMAPRFQKNDSHNR